MRGNTMRTNVVMLTPEEHKVLTDEIEHLRRLIDEGNATFATWKANYAQFERELDEARDERQREHDLRVRLAGELETATERLAEARRHIRRLVDLAEFWINREDRRRMSEHEYKTWVALGFQSGAYRDAHAFLAADQPSPQTGSAKKKRPPLTNRKRVNET